MSSDLLVNISPFISKDPVDGHFFSVHKKFQEIFSENFDYLTISSNGYGDEGQSLSLLTDEFKSRDVLLDLSLINKFASSIDKFVKPKLKDKATLIYHFYEGNLNQFLLVLELLKLDNFSKIIFNFHWFEEEKNNIRSLFASNPEVLKAINLYIDLHRLHLSCESNSNSLLFTKMLKRAVNKYPIFSVYSPTYKKVQKNIIVLIPSSQAEIDFLHKVIKTIPSKILRYKIICLGHWEKSNSKLNYLALQDLGIDLILDYIPSKDYINLLNHTEIMILPYQTFKWYKSGSSGRLEDALVHKSFVIVPQNTSLYKDNRKIPFVVPYLQNSTISLILSILYISKFKKYTNDFLGNYKFDSGTNKLISYFSRILN